MSLGKIQRNSGFLEVDARCNAIVSKSGMRSYQSDILNEKSFSAPCPTTGKLTRVYANYVFPNKGIVYYFKSVNDFCLVSSCLHKGFPITAMVGNKGEIETTFPEGERSSYLEELARGVLRDSCANLRKVSDINAPAMIIGHRNFAHFLWNEFPCFYEAVSDSVKFDVFFLHDTLGVSKYFSEHASVSVVDKPSALRGWSDRISVLACSSYCPKECRDVLLKGIKVHVPVQNDPPPRKIYISVRPSGRTLRNQVDFISKFIDKCSSKYEGASFVLDGFSFPFDFQRSIYDGVRSDFVSRSAEAKSLVSEIFDCVSVDPGKLSDITGLCIVDGLQCIADCDFYVTHSGTHQHKVGWFFSKRGYMHGNSREISPAALKWVSDKVGGAITPYAPKLSHVEDLSVIGMPANVQRNKQYRFCNVDDVCDAIVDII